MLGPKRIPRLRTRAGLPLFRMFGLGVLAIVATIWALLRPKQPWQFLPPPSASGGEIEVDLWDGGP